MKEKTNYSSLTKFFAVSLLVWVCQYSNESSATGKSWIEEHGKNNSLAARAGRVLREDEEVIAEQRNAFLKEKLIGLIEDGEEETDDNFNFAKRFNALIQEENFQKGLNSLMKDENKKRQMNPYEYDDDIVKLHNTFNFKDNNKNVDKDVNLIEFEDFGKVQNLQKLNNQPAKQTNPFTVSNDYAKQSSSQNLYSDSAKRVNKLAPSDDFGKLHNSINVNKQPVNKPTIIAPTDDFEKLHNSINVNKQPTDKPTAITPSDDFEKLHNSINVNKQPTDKPTAITPSDDFGKLHNSINVNRQPVKKPTIIRPVDGFGKQQNYQNVNKQSTKEPSLVDSTDDFEKLHNSLSYKKPNEKRSSAYRDNDNFEKRYSTLKDDFYSEKLFNSAYKKGNYESKDKAHELSYYDDEPRRHQNYKNDFSDLKKNGRPNAHFDKMYNDLLKGTNFESEKRVLKYVDDQPRNGSGKPLIDFSEDFPKNSYERYSNDVRKSPYTKSRSSALSYAQNVEKILNKLKYFSNVETAVRELKNDPSFKKILNELQNGNALERLFYVLKYSDDSEEIISELKKSDNIEKLIYVLNHYENNSQPPKRETIKKASSKKDYDGNSKLSLLNIKKKKIILWITKMFNKFDKMYEDQLLSLFSSDLDDDENDSSEHKKILHIVKYVKVLIPIALCAVIIAVFSVLQNVTYYIISALLAASAVGYTIFKLKKCHYKKKVERINKENAKKSSKPSKPSIIKTFAF
ncbi:Plasmodium exported protein, unknown function [Plasmodium vivax]|uniref:Pv-fam-d protein n=1 Tax=Plasmodium vivax TaxID=5855 RepID=A0A565A1C8_PLAVI|nr:Plasmodium exported protein, unknown function [Plasmodium vivax]